MSDEPKFVFARGRPKLFLDGHEVSENPAQAEELSVGDIEVSGTVELGDGGDMLDVHMQVEPNRITA